MNNRVRCAVNPYILRECSEYLKSHFSRFENEVELTRYFENQIIKHGLTLSAKELGALVLGFSKEVTIFDISKKMPDNFTFDSSSI